jgi:Dioxygenases related to 2-nitropropane dioxygenase
MFETRVTELFGIKYPIIAGGMHLLSRAELVAAVSNAGGLGILASTTFETKEELREEIRKTRSLTNKPTSITNLVNIKSMKKSILSTIPRDTEKLNLAAFKRGYDCGKRLLEKRVSEN